MLLRVRHVESQGDPGMGPSYVSLRCCMRCFVACVGLSNFFSVSPCLLGKQLSAPLSLSLGLSDHLPRHSVICAPIEPCVHLSEGSLSHHITHFCLRVSLSSVLSNLLVLSEHLLNEWTLTSQGHSHLWSCIKSFTIVHLCIHSKMSGPQQVHSTYLERAKDQRKEREEWKKKAKKEGRKDQSGRGYKAC